MKKEILSDMPGIIGARIDVLSPRLQETVLFQVKPEDRSGVYKLKGLPQNHSSRDARAEGSDGHHRPRKGNARTPLKGSRRG